MLYFNQKPSQLPEYSEAKNLLKNLTSSFFNDYIDFHNNQKITLVPTNTCTPFSVSIFLTVNGYLLPCENVAHKYHFGKINENKLKLNLDDVVNVYNDYLIKCKNICQKCYNVHNCNQCMFGLDLHSEKIFCKYYMNYSKFKAKLAEVFSNIEMNPEILKKILLDE